MAQVRLITKKIEVEESGAGASGPTLSAILGGGDYRSVSATNVFADDANDAAVMAIGLRIIDPAKALLLNFVVASDNNSNDFIWGVSLNPTYSGSPAAPSFAAVPGSTALEYAVGGTAAGSKIEFSDKGILLYHSDYIASSNGIDQIDAQSMTGVQAGSGFTIAGTIDSLAVWVDGRGNNGSVDFELSLVELPYTA